jgi:hypothetical protein
MTSKCSGQSKRSWHRSLSEDPLLLAGRQIIRESLDELLAAADGLPADGLNWRPGPEDTNSVVVLVTHALHSTRNWLCIALNAPLPQRDRDSEFVVEALELEGFLDKARGLAADCCLLLATDAPVEWSAVRQTHQRPNPADPDQVPAAWALLHAVEHLREHLGQVLLTRQLFLAQRHSPPK